MNWFIYFYIIPLCLSILYFTQLKVNDIFHSNWIYTKDKLTYWQTIGICFIPILNIVIVILAVKKQFERM